MWLQCMYFSFRQKIWEREYDVRMNAMKLLAKLRPLTKLIYTLLHTVSKIYKYVTRTHTQLRLGALDARILQKWTNEAPLLNYKSPSSDIKSHIDQNHISFPYSQRSSRDPFGLVLACIR